MYLTIEFLKSIQQDLIFHSIEKSINISDCERVCDKIENELPLETLFWMDYIVIEKDLENQSAILLIEKNHYKKLKTEKIGQCRIIASSDPKLIYLTICSLFDTEEIIREIQPTAIVHPKAKIGINVYIGHNSYIDECIIGDNCIIHENVSISKGVKIGKNTVIQSGAKIGLNIFGYEKNPVGEWVKYPQIGFVRIGNNVTIGSNTCISNGLMSDTLIEDDTVIDNLCQIGSSVVINQGTKIAANSSISNNTKIGKRCWIAPGVTVKENLLITDDVFIGIGSVVVRNIKKSCTVFGVPAAPIVNPKHPNF
jgi:UDP-3-O-[3-hydroxymyristoyl] glucosamine N-acyltransferase